MKLLESYSRAASVNINDKPYIYAKYFPLGDIDRFITIQTKSGMPAKDYSYFQEVIDIIKPILDKLNIKILHLGQDSPQLSNVINLNGQTTIGQAYYIIQKSMLHLGVDSWMSHAACSLGVPCVSIYGSTTVRNHSPYHFNPDKSIFLESNRNGNKASFQREENPKTIDLIYPETIASSVCKLLNIEYTYPYKTLYIGKTYQNKIVESACDSVIDIRPLGIPNIVSRMDYNFNVDILAQQLSICKCSIVTNKPVPKQILQQFRPNIVEVIYKIEKENDPNFCKEIQDAKIPYRLYSELDDIDLNPIKFSYIDYNLIFTKKYNKPKILDDKTLEQIYYKGGKFTLARNKIYQSRWDYENDRSIPSFNAEPQPLIDINIESLFLEEEYLLFLTK